MQKKKEKNLIASKIATFQPKNYVSTMVQFA